MKHLLVFALLASAPAFAAETLCVINRQNANDPSTYGETLFSGVIKDKEIFLLKRGGQVERDFDFFNKKNTYTRLRRLNRSTFVAITREPSNLLTIGIGSLELSQAQTNALPSAGMAIGAADRIVSLTVPPKKLSVICSPVEGPR